MDRPQGSLSLRRYGASHGSHAHAHFQVLLGLEGVLELEVQGRGRRIAAGEGCVIIPGERHDFESKQGSRCLVLDTHHAGWSYCDPSPAQSTEAIALAHYLEQALQQQGSLAHHCGPLLLLQAWQRPAALAEKTARPARHQRAIDWHQLAGWTQLRLHEPLSVAQLAAQAFLSPTQFAARCRRETGQSVMQWLRSQRLALALQLQGRGVTVADTALRCGYQSPSALTAALRRQKLTESNQADKADQ
ncbi:AraC family transcriptional regulator [Polaromonas sp. JS666]|uniref:AraC family transcriptional regulator n=1 Tax=Polaromonas sp. (strain JS666 / ATCC BAA-500) TaxID=296591 RepID=UPI0000464DBA|nr:AraC family transcriptional regulator [Polaromonas sp. JS666]ABE42277.1 transcriptional regulator, AraC family [Polaromonas sp. JS666]